MVPEVAANEEGTVLSVNISAEKGTKKKNVGACRLVKDWGIADDGHAGKWHRQLSLLSKKSIEKIRAKGLPVDYGDFAENLSIEGIDLYLLPVGTTLTIGADAVIRLTQIGKECHTRCNIFYQVGDCVMPREGVFAEVLQEGEVTVGDTIKVMAASVP
ncbi:MAG: MOSC domain-containing protein [Deltaproteobacteria bacterium]|nr:MOSC domain-containing protein [Deltaproteobacteria bacterium]